ncbi:hypothetical protein C8T65DRAFT_738119 [Cerioporus squamosus]|nr:hypothetical protein C8T65DRAFT_738119 [Cerioporus squamosus]
MDQISALRDISIIVEPGWDRVRYLSGLGDPSKRETVGSDADLHEAVVLQDPRQWSYDMGRAAAVEGLLGAGLEEIMVDTDSGRLRPSFSSLQTLSVRLWDPYESKEHSWWLGEISKRLPTLYAMRIVHVDVRDIWENKYGGYLWLAA